MRSFSSLPFLSVLALGFVFAASPARAACTCPAEDGGALAARILADPAISVADMLVRGMNVRNGQSMLELKTVHRGGLMAQTIRAKFGTGECAFVPQYRQVMTMLIRAEDDGTYGIVGKCETAAVLKSLGKGR